MSDVLALLARPHWWERAACRGRGDLVNAFMVGPGDRRRSPKVPPEVAALCRHCPVKRECLADVMGFSPQLDHSIRAGLTPQMREASHDQTPQYVSRSSSIPTSHLAQSSPPRPSNSSWG